MTGKRKSTSRKLPPALKKHPTTQRLIDTHDSDETLPPSQFISDEPIVFDGWRQVSRQVSRQIPMVNKQRNLDAATNNRPILPNERRSAGGFQSNKQAPLSCTDNSLTPRPRANDIDAARNFMEDDNDSQLPNIESSATVSGILPRSTIVRGLYKGVDLDKLTNEKKKKLIVFIPPGKYISPIGEHERKLASWLGYCARSVGPPIESWRKIEKDKGLLLFKMVKDYFDISPESPEKWKKLEEKGDVKPDTPEMKQAKFEMYCFNKMGILYRKWKHNLHIKYMKYTNDEDRLNNTPQGLSPEGWKSMFDVFRQQEFLETSQKNTFNRSRQRIIASTGPTPFVQVEYDMMDEEIGVPPISEVWLATHGFVNENGSQDFHDSESSRIYEEMQRIENQPKDSNEPIANPDDVLKEVCGTKSGYVRGRGLGYIARKYCK